MARRHGLWADFRDCESAPGNAAAALSRNLRPWRRVRHRRLDRPEERSDSHHAGAGFGWFGRRATLGGHADRRGSGGAMRHIWMGAVVLAAALVGSSCSVPAPAQQAKPRPAWLHDTPIVLVSNHDSMPIFRRRVGGNPTWQEEDYEKEHSEESIRKLKALGVTVVIVHFYKGFGLEAEHDHM